MVVAALAGLWAGGALAAPGCQLIKLGELPVKFDHNRPLVPVSINGTSGWFLVDTGAQASMMFGGAARAFGLHQFTQDHVTFSGVGGSKDAEYTVVKDFALSDVKVKSLTFYVIGQSGSPAEAGLLGRDFLSHFNLEFDLANKALRLWKTEHCGNQSLAYWTNTPGGTDLDNDGYNGQYSVKSSINGRAIKAILDSGATTSVVTSDAASAVGLRPTDFTLERHKSAGIGDHLVDTRVATFDRVDIGTEQIHHARLEVADLFGDVKETETGSILPKRVQLRDQPDMLLGADFLRSHRVFIAADQHLMYFTYSGGPIFQVVGEAVAAANAAPTPATAPPTPAIKP
jgi:predicted aspartyl protease